MRLGRDVEGGFETLDDHGDVIAIAYPDEKSGRVDVTPCGSYDGLDPPPTMTQELQTFAEDEARQRKAVKKQA